MASTSLSAQPYALAKTWTSRSNAFARESISIHKKRVISKFSLHCSPHCEQLSDNNVSASESASASLLPISSSSLSLQSPATPSGSKQQRSAIFLAPPIASRSPAAAAKSRLFGKRKQRPLTVILSTGAGKLSPVNRRASSWNSSFSPQFGHATQPFISGPDKASRIFASSELRRPSGHEASASYGVSAKASRRISKP